MTPKEALAQAIIASQPVLDWRPDVLVPTKYGELAAAILAALPEGSALVTAETLADALDDVVFEPVVGNRGLLTVPEAAAAIIEALRRG